MKRQHWTKPTKANSKMQQHDNDKTLETKVAGSDSIADDTESGKGEQQQPQDPMNQSEQALLENIKEHKSKLKNGSKMVYLVLFFASIGFGTATYFLLKESTENEFRSEVSFIMSAVFASVILSISEALISLNHFKVSIVRQRGC